VLRHDAQQFRILVPLDGSSASEAILTPIRKWAERLRAEVVLAQTVTAPVETDEQLGLAHAYLQAVGVRLQSDRLHVWSQVVRAQSAPDAIAQLAQREHADLIAMATHGRSGLPRLVLGSVAREVVQRAHVPVLLVRPSALVAQAAA
jgi:nucleotide-binding universal stress UspA family protein